MSWDILPKSNLQYFLQKLKEKFDLKADKEEVDTELDTKVDKVSGKGLSTNDYTNEEKALVATIPNKADSDDVEGTKTVTGNPLTLTDAAPINAESLVVELEPKQDLHGYDFPWVGGAWKNKCEPISETTTIKGITITPQSDGSIILNGTKTTDDDGIRVTGTYTTVAGQEQIASIVGNSPLPTGIEDFGFIGYGKNNFITPSSSYSSSGIQVYINQGTTLTNVRLYPQIEMGSSRTTFAPYSNICPITGYTECDVDDVGKNLWSEGNVSGTLSNRIDISFPAGTYNMSAVVTSSDTDDSKSIVIASDANGAELVYLHFGRGVRENFSFTVNKPIATIRFYASDNYVKSEGDTFTYSDIQLEKGSTATPYEPYRSSNATIQFGQTVYGGVVDFLTGVLTVDRAIVDLGDLTWDYRGSTAAGLFRTTGIQDYKYESITPSVASCYKYQGVNVAGISDFANAYDGRFTFLVNATTGSKGFYVKNLAYTDATAFKTAMSGQTVCYELATPQIIQLTPRELQLLKQYNNITTNGTTINLDYIPDNSIGDAVRASEEYTDRAMESIGSDVEEYVEKTVTSSYGTYTVKAIRFKNGMKFMSISSDDFLTPQYWMLPILLTIDGITNVKKFRPICFSYGQPNILFQGTNYNGEVRNAGLRFNTSMDSSNPDPDNMSIRVDYTEVKGIYAFWYYM